MVPPQLYLFLISCLQLTCWTGSIHCLPVDTPTNNFKARQAFRPTERRLSKLNVAASILVTRSSLQKHSDGATLSGARIISSYFFLMRCA
jgi:hypothetical protein